MNRTNVAKATITKAQQEGHETKKTSSTGHFASVSSEHRLQDKQLPAIPDPL